MFTTSLKGRLLFFAGIKRAHISLACFHPCDGRMCIFKGMAKLNHDMVWHTRNTVRNEDAGHQFIMSLVIDIYSLHIVIMHSYCN